MAAIAQPAQGTVLSYSTDGTTYNVIGEVTHIKGAGASEMGKRDTTVLTSTIHTARPTIPTVGPLSFGLNWDPTDTNHAAIAAMAVTPLASDPTWKVVFNMSGSLHTYVFTGFVTNFDGGDAEDVDSNVTGEVTIYVNAVPTIS